LFKTISAYTESTDLIFKTFNKKYSSRDTQSLSREKRHACPDCGKCFTRRRLLQCHANAKHAGRRPHGCTRCPATFVYPEHVRKHVAIMHEAKRKEERTTKKTEEGLLGSCPGCSLSFKSRAGLERHKCRQRQEAAATAAAGRPVILCLPDSTAALEGGPTTGRLCYAGYLGKETCGLFVRYLWYCVTTSALIRTRSRSLKNVIRLLEDVFMAAISFKTTTV
jgi:hypothetical protein